MRRLWVTIAALVAVITIAIVARAQSVSRGITTWHADEVFVTQTQAALNSLQQQINKINTSFMSVSTLQQQGPVINVTSDSTTSLQIEYVQLNANVTTINTPCAFSMPDGKIIYLILEQPTMSSFTSPSCFTACGGTQVYVTNSVTGGTQGTCGGSGAIPTLAGTPFSEIDYSLQYRATVPAGSTPTLRVMSAAQ